MRPHLQATAFITTACIVLVLSTLGCGGSLDADYSSIGLVPVSGTVTLDGEPIEGAVVFFEADDRTFSYGTTDDSGHYELKFNSKTTGVTQGPKTVRISTVASTGERGEEDEEESESESSAPKAKRTERFPVTYNKKSELQVSVSDSQTTFNFDLRGDGTTKNAS
ncbi:carboxypeptidase-like regulatory domain-containing protein [Novipirellula rosea]|uniref:Carboxypeptidase-like regulatory domain-containing protein n=1 Tax=Novipirellula rosea TaxID=1031540 RepID=A0ABP8MKQ5_9BACT